MSKSIVSLQNPYVKHLVHLRQNSDYRYEHKSVPVEGIKMVREVAQTIPLKTLLVYDESLIPKGLKAQEVFVVNEAVMKKISGMQAPEGIMAEVAMPPSASLEKARFIIALDHVNDPGNLGAILRTALAFGWDGAFLIGHGCDPYNEKALRSARGATFRLPLRQGSAQEFNLLAKTLGVQPLAADIHGEKLEDSRSSSACILVLGNEARGLSPEIAASCKRIAIPMSGPMESLNVAIAGGILMYAQTVSRILPSKNSD
jgi:TrmH family RNA methyltransferase